MRFDQRSLHEESRNHHRQPTHSALLHPSAVALQPEFSAKMTATHSRRTGQLHSSGVERVTFAIKAGNRGDVLGRVVQLFEDLNAEIEAVYMIRRRGAQILCIHATVEGSEEGRRQIETRLEKVVSVTSVEIERSAKQLLDLDETEERPRSQQ